MTGDLNSASTLETIKAVIAPLVGPVMAEASVTLQAKKVGVTDGQITGEQLQSLVESIRSAMTVFVGADKAQEIEDEIRKQVGGH